jgi:hypothetical protein
VIAEGVVLLRVEHLEERRRRITAEIRSELVDLVEEEDRVSVLAMAETCRATDSMPRGSQPLSRRTRKAFGFRRSTRANRRISGTVRTSIR